MNKRDNAPVSSLLPAEYSAHCPHCGHAHRLPNDVELASRALAGLFAELETEAFAPERAALQASPGKMIGVLVARSGEVLRAYSGELGGRRDWPRWAPPVLRRADTAALEAITLESIAECERLMSRCDLPGARLRVTRAKEVLEDARRGRAEARREPEQWAAHQRSRRAAALALEVAKQALADSMATHRSLKEQRKAASMVLSDAIFDAATVTNARGVRRPLREIFAGGGLVGGTTDCTVPKLLESANVRGLKPVAIAEAWWGPSRAGREHGEPQAPCELRCQPILGYLLCSSH